MASFDMSSYWHSTITMALDLLYHSRKSNTDGTSQFFVPHLNLMPLLREIPSELATIFYTEQLEWSGYQKVKKSEDTFNHFRTIHEHDGQTDTA